MRIFLLMGALAVTSSGCTHYVFQGESVGLLGGSSLTVQAQQGKAYVIQRSFFSSTLWNCDSTSGEPVCTRVVELPAAGK